MHATVAVAVHTLDSKPATHHAVQVGNKLIVPHPWLPKCVQRYGRQGVLFRRPDRAHRGQRTTQAVPYTHDARWALQQAVAVTVTCAP